MTKITFLITWLLCYLTFHKQIIDNGIKDWIGLRLLRAIPTLVVKLSEPRTAGQPPPLEGIHQVLPWPPFPGKAFLVSPDRPDAGFQALKGTLY